MPSTKKSRKLSTNQMKELRQAFDLFDYDRSGFISSNELKKALLALGIQIDEHEVKQIFSSMDLDKDGRIGFNEFAEIFSETFFKKFSRSEILEAFRRFDLNNDGFIEAHELRNVLVKLGKNFSNDEIRRMIAQVDRDGNGKISIEEFASIIGREY